ncbi:4387_t:CDS:2 [Entrophospora sp. SA101]|nr:4387_t:CDS:2 [Entrophospora sp. SA101]CAJ0840079.1 10404_t:CDS:2 [Entrophospora sp. SA101]CAJ0840093.1 10409_t:CDS:2 [Entrophospora sp. SA101]
MKKARKKFVFLENYIEAASMITDNFKAFWYVDGICDKIFGPFPHLLKGLAPL